jgi:hypothetical protein
MTTSTTGGIASNLSLPQDRWPLGAIRDARPTTIGEIITAATEVALQRSNAAGGIKGTSRTTYAKGDLESLHRTFEVALIGMMSQDIHAINEVIPINVTDDYRFTTEELIFDPQLPKMSAPMSGPDMMHFRKTRRVTTSTKYNMGFELDGDIRRLEEGVQHVQMCMSYMAGSFNKLAAFVTMSGLIKSGLHNIHRKMLTKTMQLMQYEEWVNEDHDEFAVGNKKRTGIDNLLYKYSEIVREMSGYAPDVCFFPTSQKVLFYANKQYNTYQYGGQDAMDVYQGRKGIDKKHNMTMLEAPLAPDQRFKYSQLFSTRRTGEFLAFEKKSVSHDWKEGFLVQDLNRDDSMYNVKVDDLMPGLLFVQRPKPDAKVLGQHLSVKLKLILDMYQVLGDLDITPEKKDDYYPTAAPGSAANPMGIPNTVHLFFTEYAKLQGYFTSLDTQSLTKIQQTIDMCFGHLTSLTTGTEFLFSDYHRVYSQFGTWASILSDSGEDYQTRVNNYNTNEQLFNSASAKFTAGTPLSPLETKILNAGPPVVPTTKTITANDKLQALRQVIGNLADTTVGALETALVENRHGVLMLHIAAKLNEITKGAYTTLFRKSGVYGTRNTAAGSLNFLGVNMSSSNVFKILGSFDLAEYEPVYVVDFVQFYNVVYAKKYHRLREGTPFTLPGSGALDPKPWVVNASCYMEDDYAVLTMNPYETSRNSRCVIAVSGEDTAIMFICPPEVTDAQDWNDQHLAFHTSMYYAYVPRNDRRVMTLSDVAYSGVISGANWKVFTYAEHERFANQLYFDAPNNDYPCRVVFAVRKSELRHRRFINTPGRPPVTGADSLAWDYPHAEFYNKMCHWDTCQSELRVPLEKRKKVIATCLYRAGYSYKDKTGWIHVAPDTVHGPYSRQPNALSIRQRGDCLYDKTMD